MTVKKFVLVGARSEDGTPKQYGGVLTLSNGLVDYARQSGFEIDVINTLRSGFEHQSILKRLLSGLARGQEMFSLLRTQKRAGVIIFCGAGWSFFERILLALIARMFAVPCIFFIVDGWFLEIRKKSRFTQFCYRLLLKIPSKLAASGLNWVRFFRQFSVPEHKIVAIHYWLPKLPEVSNTPKSIPADEVVRFVFVGWMIKEKGILEILSVLDSLVGKYPLHFTFIGGGTLLPEVSERIRSARWEGSVSALGWLPPDRITNELNSAHVFVLPSYAEGFPMSLIEAMTQGMPAICTDVGGISDSLQTGKNGILIQPKDVSELERAMTFYLENPDAIYEQSTKTLQIVRDNHDPDKNCRLLLDALGASR